VSLYLLCIQYCLDSRHSAPVPLAELTSRALVAPLGNEVAPALAGQAYVGAHRACVVRLASFVQLVVCVESWYCPMVQLLQVLPPRSLW
jgi:hypothetical protein